MIRLANYGPQPYVGWVRTKTDSLWPSVWRIGDTLGVMGAWEGDAQVVDLKVSLQPGQVLELDPAQAVGCYGLDLACEVFNVPEGRELALRGAHAVLRRAFFRDGDRWTEWERLGYDGTNLVLPVEGNGGHRTGWYRAAWFPLAPATVLRHEPGNERALSIWRQQLADGGGGGAWFPPEVAQ